MYDELVNRLNSLAALIARNGGSDLYVSAVAAEATRKIAQEAANAIEELSKRVPKTPHGRLIDADALKVSLVFAEKTARWAVPALRATLMVIDETPTIIPAEENHNDD